MSLPNYESIEEPLLVLLYRRGGRNYEMRTADTYKPLAKYFKLTFSDMEQTVSPTDPNPRWNNMVRWAREQLRKRGYLGDSPRGVWRLSDDGLLAAGKLDGKFASTEL